MKCFIYQIYDLITIVTIQCCVFNNHKRCVYNIRLHILQRYYFLKFCHISKC